MSTTRYLTRNFLNKRKLKTPSGKNKKPIRKYQAESRVHLPQETLVKLPRTTGKDKRDIREFVDDTWYNRILRAIECPDGD